MTDLGDYKVVCIDTGRGFSPCGNRRGTTFEFADGFEDVRPPDKVCLNCKSANGLGTGEKMSQTYDEFLKTVTAAQLLDRSVNYWPRVIAPPDYKAEKLREEIGCAIRNDPAGAADLLLDMFNALRAIQRADVRHRCACSAAGMTCEGEDLLGWAKETAGDALGGNGHVVV